MKAFRLVFLIIILTGFHFGIYSQNESKQAEAKYVFLFIGDGMGFAHVNITEAYLASLHDRIGFEHLEFTTFPQVGTVSTYANNRLITCSAAAGTALATGNKTNIDRISMDPAGEKAFETVAEKAKKNGYKVGIVTSVSIDHATPAVFYAHQPDRDMYFEIGQDLVSSGFDFFAGGGFLIPDGTIDDKPVNLVELAKDSGYHVVNTKESFKQLSPQIGKTLVLSPRPADEASLPYALDMNPEDITLADFTKKAIDMLDNEKGFFIMVEGGKIDWAGHANDAASVVQEVLAFDEAIEVAHEFYKEHLDETLILVTADHETGALGLGHGAMKYSSDPSLLKYQKSSLEELNKIVGQFRVNKSGDPEADFDRMLKVLETDLGLNSLKAGTVLDSLELAALKSIFKESVYGMSTEKGIYGDYEPFMSEAVKILNKKAGISWGSNSHTAINVPIYSIGVGSEFFEGYIDNTDIPKTIEWLMGIQ